MKAPQSIPQAKADSSRVSGTMGRKRPIIQIVLLIISLLATVSPSGSPPDTSRADAVIENSSVRYNLADKKVLVLHSNNAFTPANRIVDNRIYSILTGAGIPTSSIYSEYVDLRHFHDRQMLERYIQYLRDYYTNQKIDIIIAVEGPTLDFLIGYGGLFDPGLPVVLCAVTPQSEIPESLKRRLSGNYAQPNIRRNIENIIQLQPDIEDIYIVSGSGRQDRTFEQIARTQLDNFFTAVQVHYLDGLSVDMTVNIISRLPGSSAVLVLSVFTDGAQTHYNPFDVMKKISECSPVPVYGISDTFNGSGFAGGNLMSFNDLADDAAHCTIKILKGAPPAQVSPKLFTNRDYYDWQQLQKWNISSRRIPEGAIVYNRPPPIWYFYRRELIVTGVFFIISIILIAALSSQLRYRRFAEAQIAESSRLLERILKTTPTALFVYNLRDDRFDYANRSIFYDLGYNDDQIPPELNARVMDQTIHPDDLPVLSSLLNGLKYESDYEKPYESLLRIRHSDGKYRWIQTHFTAFTTADDGSIESLLISAVDITEKKENMILLQSALEENKLLFRELNHRTKNNMGIIQSLLELYAPALTEEKSRVIFRDMTNRIRAMALAHEQLYQTRKLYQIKVPDYIKRLTDLLSIGFNNSKYPIDFILAIDDFEIALDRAIPLGLMINELITNSYKHGGSKKLSVSLTITRYDDSSVFMDYRDNGAGLPEGFSLERDSGTGFQTIVALGKNQMGGDFNIIPCTNFHCSLHFTPKTTDSAAGSAV